MKQRSSKAFRLDRSPALVRFVAIGAVSFLGLAHADAAFARVCTTFPTPQPTLASPILSTGFSNAGGVSEVTLSGTPSLQVTASAATETPGTNSNPRVAGGPGGRINYSSPVAPDAAFGLDPFTNTFTFERAINVRIESGSNFPSAMDISHDRLTFEAIGAPAGFTWIITSLKAGATIASISPDGLTITIDAPLDERPRNFAEFDFQTNSEITGLRVTHSKPVGSDNNNARFAMHVPECVLETDLLITKTNTPGVNGEVDQTSDTVISGSTVTYVLTVSNNGPNVVTGAVVTDTPTSGLTCAPTNSVSITGDGVPAGSFTIADLTGASGITLGELDNGDSATLTYNCQVN